MRPVFAKGKTQQRTVSQQIGAGSSNLYITNASSYFSIGDEVFISESNGSNAEYLGPVKSVDAVKIVTTLSTKQLKSNSAIVWKPTNYLKLYAAPSSPIDRKYFNGIDILRTEGGSSYATKIADSYEQVLLAFENYSRSEFLAYENWLKNIVNDGIDTFAYADEDANMYVARITDTAINQFEKQIKNVQFKITLEILERDRYE